MNHDISIDSRRVEKGDIYVCCVSDHNKARDYITQAFDRGASDVVADLKLKDHLNDSRIKYVSDIKNELFNLLSTKYNNLPKICGVTGTSGKTSVVNFAGQILEMMNQKAISIGTLGLKTYGFDDSNLTNIIANDGKTSIDVDLLYRALDGQNNISTALLEASSHGLTQQRFGNIKFSIAAFTNFSQDHLDYHGNMHSYFDAKMILFKELLKEDGFAVINADIPEYTKIVEILKSKKIQVFDYGKNAKSLKLIAIESNIMFFYKEKEYSFQTELKGTFQVYNLLCAIGIILSLGYNIDSIVKVITNVKNISARMERIGDNVILDFAHKPDALEKVLLSIREFCKGKIITVFGCGGNRDKSKRAIMGEIASKLSDYVIVTDDNPRFENPSNIRSEVISGIKGNNYEECKLSRSDAIKKAILMIQKDDIVLVAGKGHEDYMIIEDKKIPYSDVAEIKKFIT